MLPAAVRVRTGTRPVRRLSDDDIAELDVLDRTGGTDQALERKWWRG